MNLHFYPACDPFPSLHLIQKTAEFQIQYSLHTRADLKVGWLISWRPLDIAPHTGDLLSAGQFTG